MTTRTIAATGVLLAGLCPFNPASAQKLGGTLHIYHRDSPASMSILEEATLSTSMPMMAVFNNLLLYDQHVPQNSLQAIVPELATGWAWSEDGKDLSFTLRQGVKWHDGRPFTANDVKCTWDLLTGKSSEKLRINPRKAWYQNLEAVTPNGDFEVTFQLKRPQPALLALLASGLAPVYPCHVAPRDMRAHPIGTGPFKFVEFKPNESIRIRRNPDYWKQDRPYLDGIEWTVVPNRSTAILGFAAGKFDLTWPYDVAIPLLKDLKAQAPQAICEVAPLNAHRSLIVNSEVAPFDNPEIRRAMALSLDRKAFIDILDEGQGDIGGALPPPSAGVWGLPPELLTDLPGYGPDVEKRRSEARGIMAKLGFGPDHPLAVKVSSRNIPISRDPAIILIDQLKTIHIDGELDPVDTAVWLPKLLRKDYVVGLNLGAAAIDDPDPILYTSYVCGADLNVTRYCNREIDRLIDQQSMEPDREQRKRLVSEIDRRLQQDGARPIIFYYRAATCRQPYVKGVTIMVNSIFNGWRMEDAWLDK
jgi:peptide/nickel transport system substrate-binding protein